LDLEEYASKMLLASASVPVPLGRRAWSAEEARVIAGDILPCVVKAQVPAGKRGKSGGIRIAHTAAEAAQHAEHLIGMTIGGHVVRSVLVEALMPPSRQFYASVTNDSENCSPALLVSAEGGVDVEENLSQNESRLRRVLIDIRVGLTADQAREAVVGLDAGGAEDALAAALTGLYDVYRKYECELVEVNPLAVTANGKLVALDCKITIDDNAADRQADVARLAAPEKLTALEARARERRLKFIELDGTVGILANGAGLTMTTMDAVTYHGGRPANFLEIGGESYTQGGAALEILLANPRVRSVLVNFCGAFARTDVMAANVVDAWRALEPAVPIFFTIHGTGEEEAISLVKEGLGFVPFDRMDDAVRAAVDAARERVG
jgi:succinyl-CoA synthetase beta subunit